jgi:hypothetical protein
VSSILVQTICGASGCRCVPHAPRSKAACLAGDTRGEGAAHQHPPAAAWDVGWPAFPDFS